ncbi:MAG: 50S ribosomal protein L10 [Nanoarchaeota archaeon]|nr:50S ribosomal protein L10 [Nanoarchaeota archaeon]
MEKNKFRKKEIPKKKIEEVKEIAELIKKSNSIMIVSVKDLPTSQFQNIKKNLRENGSVKIIKKTVMQRAIDSIEKGAIKNFKGDLKEDIAIIFSNLNPFELSLILSKSKSKARAKTGQIAQEDIIIEPGPTELIPGPIISELGGLGIKFTIENGKINIKEKKVIVKANEKINENVASILGKLDMKPLEVGLEPIIAYDSKEDKIYKDIKIDIEKTTKELKNISSSSLAFAVKINYPCKKTIGFILGKAASHEKALSELIKQEPAKKENENPVALTDPIPNQISENENQTKQNQEEK